MNESARKSREPVLRDIRREIEAATILRQQIAALADGDEGFVRDVIEGETSLHEVMSALVADDAVDAALVDGMKTVAEGLTARRERIEKRIEVRRALIASGLEIAGLPKLETPIGTAAVRPVPPKVIVTDESLIPAAFWKRGDPKLDKKALGAALKEKRDIAGATLSNGGTTLEIRRS